MKQINRDEFNRLQFSTGAATSQSKVAKIFKTLNGLDTDEGILVSAKEWPLKTSPGTYIRNHFTKNQSGKVFTVRLLSSRKGYAILRKA